MSDLDDDLLALAGVTDSEDETISTKKRKMDDSDNEDELINPYPLENKFKDEQDREKLMAMDEITREELLFERSQEMERFNEKKFLQERAKQQRDQSNKATRSSKRSKPTGGSRSDKLSELRKQRERKKRRDDYSDEEEEEDEDLEEELRDLDDEYQSDYDEGQVVWGTKTKSKSYTRAKFEDINKALVGRSFMNKYYFYPNLEDTIIDCYGRINLGLDKRRQPMYRMVKIIDVQHLPEKKYKMPNFEGDMYVNVSQNKKQTKLFPISVFSDSAILPDEFDRYVKELEKNNEEIDYVDDVNEKHDQITEMVNKSLTDHDINEMIEKKQRLHPQNGFNAVFQKATLMDKLKIAKQQNNLADIISITNQLNDIENALVDTTSNNNSKSLDTMSKVNERNRKLNLENIRKAEIKSSIMRKTASKDQGDPFQRLKTVTRVFYQDMINSENEKAKEDAKMNYKKMLDEKTEIENTIAKSSYRLLGVMDQLIGGIDVDFELSL